MVVIVLLFMLSYSSSSTVTAVAFPEDFNACGNHCTAEASKADKIDVSFCSTPCCENLCCNTIEAGLLLVCIDHEPISNNINTFNKDPFILDITENIFKPPEELIV